MTRKLVTNAAQVIAALFLYCTNSEVSGEPLPDTDLGPLTGLFAVPDASRGAVLPVGGTQVWSTNVAVASHALIKQRSGESLRFDGETRRLSIAYAFGVTDRLALGVELPYLWHESGGLDNLIDNWHDAFGFKARARNAQPQDALSFTYTDENVSLVDLRRNVHGAGDVRMFAGWRLNDSLQHAQTLRFEVKLPTGESSDLLGSGGADVSVGFAGDLTKLWGQDKLSGFYRANLSYLGKPDILADRYRSTVASAALGIGLGLNNRVRLKLQTRLRSAIYNSNIDNLGGPSLSLTFGGSIDLAEQYRLMLSIGEDLKPATAPDVVFQLGLAYYPTPRRPRN